MQHDEDEQTTSRAGSIATSPHESDTSESRLLTHRVFGDDREQYVNAEELWKAGLERTRAGDTMLPPLDAHRLHQALYPSFTTLPNTIDGNLFRNTYRYPGATARAIRTVECLVNFLNNPSMTRKSAADFLAYARLVGDENRGGLAEDDEFSHTWEVLHHAIGFAAYKDYVKVQYTFFDEIKAIQFPSRTKTTTFNFTLEDFRRLEISILPTKLMEEHLKLEGGKVKVLILRGDVPGHLGDFKYNKLTRALGLHTLGAEILASLSVLYGKDATEVYAEGTAAGLLPKIADMDPINRTALFLVMHTIENRRPPELLASRVHAIQDLIHSRSRWWNVLFRDIRRQRNTQPFIFYGALAAIFFGICSVIQTLTSVWGLVITLRSVHG